MSTSSRLDRLILLLHKGTTPATRHAAALQIGEVVKVHPEQLQDLLAKIHVYLKNKSWETRIAAGQAYDAIASQIPLWNPPDNPNATGTDEEIEDGQLSFDDFDLDRVIATDNVLLGSQGLEYEIDEETAKLEPKERLKRLRMNVKDKLMGVKDEDNFDIGGMVDADDLAYRNEPKQKQSATKRKSDLPDFSGLSGRERNAAMRRAKKKAKVAETAVETPGMMTFTPAEGSKSATTVTDQADPNKIVVESKVDLNELFTNINEWPFRGRCEELCNDLFHAQWEIRHGAAVGLREIIKTHGRGAGRSAKASQSQDAVNDAWLEDMALRLVCVCAMDRFGDFSSDQVVGPVRDTCAQVLGTVVKFMKLPAVSKVLAMLLQLQKHPKWEVRHGGLLGVKYLVAIRTDLVEVLLDDLLPVITIGLANDDDVRAAAADALLPISKRVVECRPGQVSKLLKILWDSLLDLDDLTVSTSSILLLLADLVVKMEWSDTFAQQLVEHVPRLFPFFRHTLALVRKCVLRTIRTLVKSVGKSAWLETHLVEIMRHAYQGLLIEENDEVIVETALLWEDILATCSAEVLHTVVTKWVPCWLTLLVTPEGIEISKDNILIAKHINVNAVTVTAEMLQQQEETAQTSKKRKQDAKFMDEKGAARAKKATPRSKALVGGGSQVTIPNTNLVLAARNRASKALGQVVAVCDDNGLSTAVAEENLLRLLSPSTETGEFSSTRCYCAGIVARDWGSSRKNTTKPFSSQLSQRLMVLLTDKTAAGFMELKVLVGRMRMQVYSVLQSYSLAGLDPASIQRMGRPASYGVDTALKLLETAKLWDSHFREHNVTKSERDRTIRCLELTTTISELQSQWHTKKRMIQSSFADAVVSAGELPQSLNPIIKPLMDSIKKEEHVQCQQQAANAMTKLLRASRQREKCPNPKIVKNLSSILCKDPLATPLMTSDIDPDADVVTLARLKKAPESKSASSVKVGNIHVDGDGSLDNTSEETLNYRGASFAFTGIGRFFGANLMHELPSVFENVDRLLSPIANNSELTMMSVENGQEVINGLQLLETIVPSLDASLIPQVEVKIPSIMRALQHPNHAVRYKASMCIASCAVWHMGTVRVMQAVSDLLFPLLADVNNDVNRKGASEALYNIVEKLQLGVIPYIVLLVIPILGCMSDFNAVVREIISRTFAQLMILMPLESGVPNPHDMPQKMIDQKNKDRRFLDQLMDPSKLEHYKLPLSITAELRSYQQDGLNWMKFLNTYKLHGILCDDMGLGKTLQSICMVVGSHADRAATFKQTKRVDVKHLPSLIVCPTTLTVHWGDEFNKWCPGFKSLLYMGAPNERRKRRSEIMDHDVIVLSYETLRNEVEYFKGLRFNYCILDEGHVIKNPKSKVTMGVKQVQCNHRILLSGTPIQNNVVDLWSLFDFLMPGFLGTMQQFQHQYAVPIAKSRDAKANSKQQEMGMQALERLHRQVLPFLLRRMKEDVLSDLPPKIIQDYNCDLSELQRQLYPAFDKSQIRAKAEEGGTKKSPHIFQALQYLRKVCNHPRFVVTQKHPEYKEIKAMVRNSGSTLDAIEHSGKLMALKQLLIDCGFGSLGNANTDTDDSVVESAVGEHRALVFAQSKEMLDLIEKELLGVHMPTVTFMRLDGRVPASKRQDIVNKFNNDPTIDLLLLTTAVGGLGLTLTGADTVIFTEHDWNPSKDLQAMDRAHRIGQKKRVNVYRLITRGTLEEKIMGLQKFKQMVFNEVFNSENNSLESMGTNQLLDLFEISAESEKDTSKSSTKTLNLDEAMNLENDLWSEDQYDDLQMDNFISSVKK